MVAVVVIALLSCSRDSVDGEENKSLDRDSFSINGRR